MTTELSIAQQKMEAMEAEIEAELEKARADKKGCFGLIICDPADPNCTTCKDLAACKAQVDVTKVEQMAGMEAELAKIEKRYKLDNLEPKPAPEPKLVEKPTADTAKSPVSSKRLAGKVVTPEQIDAMVTDVLLEKPEHFKDVTKITRRHLDLGTVAPGNVYNYAHKIIAALTAKEILAWDGDKKHKIYWS